MLMEFVDGVYTHEQSFGVMGLALGIRMTVLRMGDGGLLLHSPVPHSPELEAAVRKLGEVRHIVGPNLFHHLYLGHWKAVFPEATLWAPPGLTKKRDDLTLDGELGRQAPEALAQDFDLIAVDGQPALDERILRHRASGTVIVTDQVFNIHETNLFTTCYLKLSGIHQKVGSSGLLKMGTRDKAAARASMDRVLAWDFDHLVMAHGELIRDDARDKLREGVSWLG